MNHHPHQCRKFAASYDSARPWYRAPGGPGPPGQRQPLNPNSVDVKDSVTLRSRYGEGRDFVNAPRGGGNGTFPAIPRAGALSRG